MNNLAISSNRIPAMNDMAIEKICQLEAMTLLMPQKEIVTSHILHGGMYARTIMIPAGVIITGALIKIATMLIVQGEALVYIGNDTIELHGYNVLPASANRKQAFVAKTDTYLTMIFPSNAKHIEEAEAAFTDDSDRLISRKQKNHIVITGE